MLLRRLALLAAPLLASTVACSVAPSEDAASAESADTGWLGDTSYELGGTIKATVEQKAEGEWAELATNDALQVSLVDSQWKFAKNRLKKAGYDLNQLADTVKVTSKVTTDGVVKLTYEAKVDLLHELGPSAEVPAIENVAPRKIALKLPVAPIGAYALGRGKCADTSDGSPDGDRNFFYYFDPDASGCDLPMVSVELELTEVYERKIVYPEYDQLLADDLGDGKKGFRAALVPAEGDNDALSRFDAHKEMLEGVLRLTGTRVLDDKALRFTYTKGNTAIVIDLFDPTKTELTPQFRSALSGYQLVFFNGHSVYGTRDLLEEKNAFSSKYQIIMLHACRTYPYYVRQIFRAKANAQDPIGWANADVVASGESSYPTDSPRTLQPLLEGLLTGMASADGGTGAGAPSWNGIVKKMNDRTSGIMYGVAGVRTNAWKPR